MRRFFALSLLLVTSLILLSLHYPRIGQIAIWGNARYSDEEIMALASVRPGDPLLWVGRWRLETLARDPWIARAQVTRYWPDRLSIQVWEREAKVMKDDTLYALDGTVLGTVVGSKLSLEDHARLVRLEGWGEDRSGEALELVTLLADFAPEVVSYSPGGFEVRLSEGWLVTPEVTMVREHWAGFTSQHGNDNKVYFYPWGVSVAP